jgi:hypothetical protein
VPEVILREDDLVFFLMDIIPTVDAIVGLSQSNTSGGSDSGSIAEVARKLFFATINESHC